MAPAARDSVTVRAGDGEPGPAERRREAAEGAGETGGGLPLREIPRVTNHFPPHSKEEEKNLGLRSSSSANTAASELEASPPAAFPSPPLVARRPGARAEPAVPSPPRCWSGTVHPVQIPAPSCREGARGLAARLWAAPDTPAPLQGVGRWTGAEDSPTRCCRRGREASGDRRGLSCGRSGLGRPQRALGHLTDAR